MAALWRQVSYKQTETGCDHTHEAWRTIAEIGLVTGVNLLLRREAA